jgi:uncharacterized protein (TIGR03790 family)
MKKNIRKNRIQGAKAVKKFFIAFFLLQSAVCLALEPAQILVIANSDMNESVSLAKYYCKQRTVPEKNILKIPLGKNLNEYISRQNYDTVLAAAVRREIKNNRKPDEIRCLLTLYGVPIKVSAAAPLPGAAELGAKLSEMYYRKQADLKTAYYKLNQLGRKEMVNSEEASDQKSSEDILKNLDSDVKAALSRIKYVDNADLRDKQYDQLMAFLKLVYGSIYAAQQAKQIPVNSFVQSLSEKNELYSNDRLVKRAEEEKWSIAKKWDENFYPALENLGGLRTIITTLKADMDRCQGKETGASVDSELSMVMFDNYDLYRWQPNELKDSLLFLPSDTLMVCRLDGPSEKIAAGLIDKAIYAEKNGLSGTAYVDARGMNIVGELSPYSYEYYDRNLNTLVKMLQNRVSMPVVFENTSKLFAEGQCPQTALYCGWYSVKRYIDAFEFVPGAIGFHIASFEAMDLRNALSSNWCPAMLVDGITATMGPVDEPYLHSFPLPASFFGELLDGRCLVEAYYRTNP